MNNSFEVTKSKSIDPLYKFTAKTFLWMFIGLAITAATAFYMVATGLVYAVVLNRWMPIALGIATLVMVVFISRRIYQLPAKVAKMLFVVYAVLTGVTFSSLGFIYDITTIYWAFGFTALMFGCLAGIGYTTKKDLTSFGPLMVVGLIMLIVFSLIGIFVNLPAVDFAISIIGVILFLGITIYDTQKMKNTYYHYQNDEVMLEKLSTFFALELYLDFINLFIYLLRIMGRND